jgi:GNAT superfamily N-acetyltransferase
MRIEHYDGLNRTPALRLALVGQLELFDLGLAANVLNVSWDHQAFVAFDEEDRAIGVLTWAHQKWSNSIDIAIGYVVPHERRQGVYGRLWDALVAKAQEQKVPVIMSSTHKGNLPMRRSAMAQGRQELGVVLQFAVPQK